MNQIALDFGRLRPIGMTAALARHLLAMAPDGESGADLLLARVAEVHRETLELHDGGAAFGARMLPRLRRELAEADSAIAVGDWVLGRTDAAGDRWVTQRLAPLNQLARRDAAARRHPLASNVDTALLVMALGADFNLRRLERYLALVHANAVAPVVVLTKADVASRAEREAACDALRSRIRGELPLTVVDARSAAAREALLPWLGGGQTLVVLGSSGAGKSTLVNTLLGVAVQDTGRVREHDERGKHTTTSRSLHLLPGGACVIDTPGLRSLHPDADEAALGLGFADIEALARQCRFRNCSHGDEPGCAVRAGVAPERLRNYGKLLRDARRGSLTALDRRQWLAGCKVRARAAHARDRAERESG